MRPFPDIEAFEERAAIAEHEGGLSRRQAETLAARDQGFRDSRPSYSATAARSSKASMSGNHAHFARQTPVPPSIGDAELDLRSIFCIIRDLFHN
jgi:hypothetical protein